MSDKRSVHTDPWNLRRAPGEQPEDEREPKVLAAGTLAMVILVLGIVDAVVQKTWGYTGILSTIGVWYLIRHLYPALVEEFKRP